MKLKLILTGCLIALGMNAQAKDYKYETVDGDLMKTRIYTLDNGLKVYLSVNPEKPRIQTYVSRRISPCGREVRTTPPKRQVWRTTWSI